ncbi:hypothetical protein CY35_17G053100 [Sphagnum magellanicum]|nr:hypothetical protein CY35_17G053100 [Sphagnum magellanicum]
MCAAAQVMHYSFQDSGRMTAAAMDCRRRPMGNIRVISTAICSQPIALLQLFTALMLSSQSASAQNAAPLTTLHIDCGSTTPSSVDTNTGITWVSDAPYITTGVNAAVAADVPDFPELNTLRYFPDSRAKNCYTLPVSANTVYLIKATFFYGAYDNPTTATLPTFQMAIDQTIVANVTFENANTGTYREISYASQANVTFLCLLRDSSQSNPFVSAISLTDLPYYGSIFRDDLHLTRQYYLTLNRACFGGKAGDVIRYPEDPYDRFWFFQGTNSTMLQSTAPLEYLTGANGSVLVASDLYGQPPGAALENAVSTSGTLTISLPGILSLQGQSSYTVRLALYFAELSPTPNSRGFFVEAPVYANGSVYAPDNYGSHVAYEEWIYFTSNVPTPIVDLVPSNNSSTSPTSGPLLNALELLEQIEFTATRTNDADAAAIEEIKSSMNLTEWTGDPCLPYPHAWINCSISSNSASPSILSVNLSGYHLNGTISPSFGNLLSLTNLYLQNNFLTGPLPDWLASLTNLSELLVQNNNFTGVIPVGLISKNNSLNFVYKPGNPGLLIQQAGPASPPQPAPKANIGIIVGAIIGGILAFAIIAFVIMRYGRRPTFGIGRNVDLEGYDMGIIGPAFKAYTSAEVVAATQNFQREIGRGGFGRVYYGRLDGQEVAIKVLDIKSSQGPEEFSNEVEILSKVRHCNLVALVGYCNQGNKQMLIYEFMHNGSLHDRLYGDSMTKIGEILDWKTRLQIALNASLGLDYLHTGCHPSIIHRDIKSSNILLPSKMEIAKVADFGLSKLTYGEDVTHVDTKVKGTIGYLDPEYFSTGQLSTKSDVFSFGVVLLEMITGRMPMDPTIQHRNYSNTSKWVEANLQKGNINEILDPIIKASNPNPETIWKVLELALQCIKHRGNQRPAMNEVVQELRIAIDMENSLPLHNHSEFNGMKVKTTMHLSHASNIELQEVHLVDYKLASDLYPV